MTKDFTKRNAVVRAWGKQRVPEMRAEQRSLGIRRHTGDLDRLIKDRYYNFNGRTNGIGYAMPRYGVFVHKGVGRGYPIEGQGSVGGRAKKLHARGYNKTAILRTLKASDKLKGARKPKPWFNPIIDKSIPHLASEVAKHDANIIARNVYIL